MRIRGIKGALDRAYSGSPDRTIGVQWQLKGKYSRKKRYGDEGKWNYREIASNEIVFDIDYDSLDRAEVRKVVEVMADVLEHEGLNFELYSSGGKGFHFHLFFDELINYSHDDRAHIRKYFLLIYGHGIAVDYAKKDENTMIGVEYARHRNGTEKKLIRDVGGGENRKLPYVVKARFDLRDIQRKVLWPVETNYMDTVRVTDNGEVGRKPCITELMRRTKEFNINRHDTALLLTSALRAEGNDREYVVSEVRRYMDDVGYSDQSSEYLYDHSYKGVRCSVIRDVLIGTGATQKCKNCRFNKEYKKR